MPTHKTIPLGNKQWLITYGKNVPKRPITTPDGKLVLTLPQKPGSLNYVINEKKMILLDNFHNSKYKIVISGEIIASENAVVDYKTEPANTCDSPAKVRPFLMKSMYGQFNRWWPGEGILLQDGPFYYEYSINDEKWTSVYGKPATLNRTSRKRFIDCLTEDVHVGFTLGGGCFFGHGLRMEQGNLSIRIDSFKINF